MLSLNNSESLKEKEEIDKDAWSRYANDNQQKQNFLLHKINKLSTARKFLDKIDRYNHIFDSASSILELGGGSCWASHIVKKFFPTSLVVGSDIAEAATNCSHEIWGSVINSQIDKAIACTSYEIPYPDESFDLIFCFESAHHFGKHKKTLTEIKRVLKPGGHCLYLNEPGCQRFIYPLAYKRVNAKRPQIPEDVLVYKNIASIARSLDFKVDIIFSPHLTNRSPKETIYFYVLNIVPILQNILPCTIDIMFTKA